MHILKKHKLLIFIFLLTFIGGIFRFYNLNWGSPFYFHPDERNIASSVASINFPNQMNPHFFAYGSFPIYLIYVTSLVLDLFLKSQDLFMQAIVISRFYSSILSLSLIPSVFFVGTKLYNRKVGLLAAAFCTFSVGFIQFAHFGTFEMWLTFLGVWFFYFSLRLVKNLNLKNIVIAGVVFGLLLSTKISSLPLFILPVITIILNLLSRIKIRKMHLLLLKIFLKTLILIFVSLIIFTAFSPYVFLDFKSFLSSMQYESSVVLGTLPVFYTGEFFNSIPVLFQFTKIYPFLLNPILTIIFIPSFLYLCFKGIKTKNPQYLILNTFYLILFLPQAFLFAKWTRYIVPTLPFMYLIIAIFLEKFISKKILSIMLISVVFAGSYFITAFINQDTRVEASLWAKENIPAKSIVLSEVYDMGIVPFNQYLRNITLFNFYDLDQSQKIKSLELKNALAGNEYIILPSPRISKTRLLNKEKFPYAYKFYFNLMNKTSRYQKVYETPCDIFCKISYLGNPVYAFEQTTNVFDRPTVFIFKKI